MKDDIFDVIVIGQGPAGMSAALYAKRAMLKTLVIEKKYAGGQIVNTDEVDNYLGLPSVNGFDLAMKFKQHLDQTHVDTVSAKVKQIHKRNGLFYVETEEEVWISHNIIAATGATHRMLNIPGEKEFTGKGVSYCATCDGAFYKGKTVAVVGGGDTALAESVYLSKICEKVILIHRRKQFRGAKKLQDRVRHISNIQIMTDTKISQICGNLTVEALELENEINDKIYVDGVFVAIGMVPETDLFKDLAMCDKEGYLIADETCRTSCRGLFAAGDLRTKNLRQVITAVSDGAVAIHTLLEDEKEV